MCQSGNSTATHQIGGPEMSTTTYGLDVAKRVFQLYCPVAQCLLSVAADGLLTLIGIKQSLRRATRNSRLKALRRPGPHLELPSGITIATALSLSSPRDMARGLPPLRLVQTCQPA